MRQISRRHFLQGAVATAGVLATGAFSSTGIFAPNALATPQEKAHVFFTNDLSVDGLLKIYARLQEHMTGRVGIKFHSGEPNAPNLPPLDFIKALQARVPNSTLVECNVLYPSPRKTTEGHRQTLKGNGFDFCPVDIMDAEGDAVLPIPGMHEFFEKWSSPAHKEFPFTPGVHLREIAVGKNLLNYDSLLVYTHFKGHTSGGFGGSLKNIAIGCASGAVGKRQIHGDGWGKGPLFLERMVEAGKGIADSFDKRIAYINVLMNISVDCDCAGTTAAKPTCRDIGIVASTDILAVDKASVDMVYALPEKELHDIRERIESRSGLRQLEYMKTLGMGSEQYTLTRV